MIIVRAPLRISFVGGGTDSPDFYRKHTGRVISTAIDKYVYVAINPTPLMKEVVARYSQFEIAEHPSQIKNDRIREALLDLGIYGNIDITTFSDLPVKTGLGSSSSFSVALIKGLHAYLGKKIDQRESAEKAARLEIELLNQPIGKQDHYAAAFGGFNIFQFNSDDTVDVQPVFLDYKTRLDFQKHLLLYFTGITRESSSVLTEQKTKIDENLDSLKQLAEMPLEFKERLMKADFKGIGKLLHDNWLKKRNLASNVSNPIIDELYQTALNAGAWGGKILGAGGGGCFIFVAEPEKLSFIKEALDNVALKHQLVEAKSIPFNFVQSGVEILMDHSRLNNELT